MPGMDMPKGLHGMAPLQNVRNGPYKDGNREMKEIDDPWAT